MSRPHIVPRVRWPWLLALLGSSLPAQVRSAGTAAAGGSITIDVAGNDATVEITAPGQGTRSHRVPPNRRVVVPVPNVPPGSVLLVSVGHGLRGQGVLVEVVP